MSCARCTDRRVDEELVTGHSCHGNRVATSAAILRASRPVPGVPGMSVSSSASRTVIGLEGRRRDGYAYRSRLTDSPISGCRLPAPRGRQRRRPRDLPVCDGEDCTHCDFPGRIEVRPPATLYQVLRGRLLQSLRIHGLG